MIPKHFKLVQEHPRSYEIHDERDGRRFHVAKQGLDLAMHAKLAKIQRFDDGGDVLPISLENPTLSDLPQTPEAPLAINEALLKETNANRPYGTPEIQAPAGEDVGERAPAPSTPSAQPTDPVSEQAASSNQGLQAEKAALTAGSRAETEASTQTARAYQDYSNKLDQMPTPQQIAEKHKQADDDLLKAYQEKTIDPDHYWNSKSTGSKILAGIGLFLSGGRTMPQIQQAIERDIDAQKNDQSKTMNLWKMNREATQDETQANLATQNQMLSAVKAKAMQYAAQAGGAESAAKLAPMIQQIDQQMTQNNFRRALMSSSQAGGMINADPSQLVPMLVQNPEQQKQVYEEIGRAQNVSNNSGKILQAFDEASKDNTVARTGAGMLRTPGSVMALHQLMLPNFKQIDGTVRQAAMDESFHNLTPAPGDTEAKIAQKRQALVNWMHSETAAPVAKGNGIDLSRFASTSANQNQSKPIMQTMNGIQYVKVPGGWKRAQ